MYKLTITQLGLVFNANIWYIPAWILPFFLTIITIAINLTLFEHMEFSLKMEGLARFGIIPGALQSSKNVSQIFIYVLIAFAGGITINALFAFGEEIGWRGLLFAELHHIGFWKLSLITGFIWGLWHTPLILSGYNYPSHPVIGVFMMIGFCILLSPVMLFFRIKTGSVIAPAIFHGTINAFANISTIFIKGENGLLIGLTGASGMISLLVLNIVLFFFLKHKK